MTEEEVKLKTILEYDCNNEDEDSYRFMSEDLSTILKEKNPGGVWNAKVENFGWNNRHGVKSFTAFTGEDLLKKILPECECSFNIFDYQDNGLMIQNFHHDSPTGNEWYYVTPFMGE